MFNIFNIKLNKKGFTLMELVVSTAIMGTLAAVAIPAYLETSESAKGTKANDTMNTIGSAIINSYMGVADQGSSGGFDIAEFTTTTTPIALTNTLGVINYGTSSTIDMDDIFPSGVPISPFGSGWTIQVIGTTAGAATWGGNPPVLTFTEAPTFVLADAVQTNLNKTFQITATP